MVGPLEVEPRGRYLGPGVAPFRQHRPQVLRIAGVAGKLAAQTDDGNGLRSPVVASRAAFGAPHRVNVECCFGSR